MAFKFEDPNSLLDNLRQLPSETDWVEFKQNYSEAEGIGRYVSALANASILKEKTEAYLVWGIENGTHEVVGTTIDLATMKKGNDPFIFWLTRQLDPPPQLSYDTVVYDGKRVEILCIQPSLERPLRFNGQGYIRIGTAQQRLSDYPEHERALWQITSRFSFESSIIEPNATLEDIDENYDYSKLLQLLGVRANSKDTKLTRMEDAGWISQNLQDRYDVKSLLAVACAVNLNEFPSLQFKGVRVIEFAGTDKNEAKSDVEGQRGYAVAFENLMKVMMARLAQKEVIEDGIRTVRHSIPEIAIREFAANALIHQDFTRQGERPTFEIFSDRVRMTNPGTPLIDADRLIDSPSKSRNPEFSNLMRQAGLCELRGSGVDRALSAIEDAVLPPPLIQVIGGSTVLTIFKERPFDKLTPEERVRACYQHACLAHERSEPMNNTSLRERFGLPQKQYPQVSIVLRDALAEGRIVPLREDQGKRYARYLPYWAR